MVQTSRPSADDTDGNWTDQDSGSSLYEAIDDPVGSPDDATTFIQVTDTSSDEACIVELGNISAPGAGNVTIKWKAITSDNAWAGAPLLKIELLSDGSGTAKDGTGNKTISTSSWTAYSHPASGSLDVSGVSDWTTLKFRITMISGDGSAMGASDIMKLTQAYLETPDAGGGGSAIIPIAMNHFRKMRSN